MSDDVSAERLRLHAHAKVNLRLRVLGREVSGYHHLETLFLRLALHDVVELATEDAGGGDGIRLEVDGPEAAGVPTGPENLCWRAAEAFDRRLRGSGGTGAGGTRQRRADPVRIRLEKRVPWGAGLGGGSADAAAVLRGLNVLHGRPLTERALHRIAGELGSDVPFALSEAPFALGWGRGRRLLPLAPPSPRPALLACPTRRIATSDAYAWLAEDRAENAPPGAGRQESSGRSPGVATDPLPPVRELGEWATLARLAANDFEDPVFRRHPELAGLGDDLREAGAEITLLAGSGSAVFGVFSDATLRDRARGELEGRKDVRTFSTEAPPARASGIP